MGTLPIALGVGAGAESRRGLGLAVVGGLLFSQVVTLSLPPFTTFISTDFRRRTRIGRNGEKVPEFVLLVSPTKLASSKGVINPAT